MPKKTEKKPQTAAVSAKKTFSVKQRRAITGSLLIIIGLAFLAQNYGVINIEVWKIWPILLVIIGANIILENM